MKIAARKTIEQSEFAVIVTQHQGLKNLGMSVFVIIWAVKTAGEITKVKLDEVYADDADTAYQMHLESARSYKKNLALTF